MWALSPGAVVSRGTDASTGMRHGTKLGEGAHEHGMMNPLCSALAPRKRRLLAVQLGVAGDDLSDANALGYGRTLAHCDHYTLRLYEIAAKTSGPRPARKKVSAHPWSISETVTPPPQSSNGSASQLACAFAPLASNAVDQTGTVAEGDCQSTMAQTDTTRQVAESLGPPVKCISQPNCRYGWCATKQRRYAPPHDR